MRLLCKSCLYLLFVWFLCATCLHVVVCLCLVYFVLLNFWIWAYCFEVGLGGSSVWLRLRVIL